MYIIGIETNGLGKAGNGKAIVLLRHGYHTMLEFPAKNQRRNDQKDKASRADLPMNELLWSGKDRSS